MGKCSGTGKARHSSSLFPPAQIMVRVFIPAEIVYGGLAALSPASGTRPLCPRIYVCVEWKPTIAVSPSPTPRANRSRLGRGR